MSDNLPPGWAQVRIGDVCDVVGGATPSTRLAANWGGDVPWITPDDLSRHNDTYIAEGRRSLTRSGYTSCSARLMPEGTVLFTSRAPIGYVAIASRALCTNQGFKSFVPRYGIHSEYLYWYLRFATPTIQALGTGTTFKEISKARAAQIELVLAPLAEQKRIVAAIEDYFSRLDAAEALIGLSINRISLLLETAIQTELRRYPTTTVSLSKFLSEALKNGRSVPTASTNGFPVLRLTCLRHDSVDAAETKQGDFGDVEPKGYIIKPDDFLISRGNGSLNLVGLGGLVPTDTRPVAFPDTLIRARVDYSKLRPKFLSLVWNSQVVRQQLEAQTRTTAGIYKVNQKMIERVSLPIPSVRNQDQIVRHVEDCRSSIRVLDREIRLSQRRIADLRRSVLAAAFSGRLVPQDSSDEPASVLLERIAASRPPTPTRRRRRP